MAEFIITADDLGMYSAMDKAIVDAYKSGLLSGTSIVPSDQNFGEAIPLAEKHNIPLGIHLGVNTWISRRSPKSLITDEKNLPANYNGLHCQL